MRFKVGGDGGETGALASRAVSLEPRHVGGAQRKNSINYNYSFVFCVLLGMPRGGGGGGGGGGGVGSN